MDQPLFQKEFESSIEAVGEAINGALSALVEHRWCTSGNSFCLRLCIEEALVNAVVHGNKSEIHRCVHVAIFDEGHQCRIRVSDEGEGFDPHAISMPSCEQLGGRGVCLIKHYMDEVVFDATRRCLEMVFGRGTFPCEEEESNVS